MSSTRQASQTGGGAKGVSQPSTGSTSSTTLSQQARRFSLPATRVPAPILFNTQPAGSGKINLQGGATSSSSRIVTSTRVVTTGPRPTTAVSGSATVAPGSQNKVLDRGSSPMPRSLLTTGPPIHAASRSTTPRLLRFDPSTMGKFTSVSPAVSRSVSAARSPSVTGGTPTLVQHPTPRHSTTTLPEAPSSGKKSTTAAGGSANKKEPEKKPAPNSTSTTNGTINPPPKQFLQVPGGGKVLSTPQVNTKLTYYTPTVPKTILQTSSSVPAMIPGTALNLKTDFGNIPTPTIQIPAATSSHKPAQTTTSVAKQKSPASVVAPSPRGGGSTSVQVPAPSSAVKAPSAMRVPFGVIAGPKPLSTDLPNRTWDTLPLRSVSAPRGGGSQRVVSKLPAQVGSTKPSQPGTTIKTEILGAGLSRTPSAVPELKYAYVSDGKHSRKVEVQNSTGTTMQKTQPAVAKPKSAPSVSAPTRIIVRNPSNAVIKQEEIKVAPSPTDPTVLESVSLLSQTARNAMTSQSPNTSRFPTPALGRPPRPESVPRRSPDLVQVEVPGADSPKEIESDHLVTHEVAPEVETVSVSYLPASDQISVEGTTGATNEVLNRGPQADEALDAGRAEDVLNRSASSSADGSKQSEASFSLSISKSSVEAGHIGIGGPSATVSSSKMLSSIHSAPSSGRAFLSAEVDVEPLVMLASPEEHAATRAVFSGETEPAQDAHEAVQQGLDSSAEASVELENKLGDFASASLVDMWFDGRAWRTTAPLFPDHATAMVRYWESFTDSKQLARLEDVLTQLEKDFARTVEAFTMTRTAPLQSYLNKNGNSSRLLAPSQYAGEVVPFTVTENRTTTQVRKLNSLPDDLMRLNREAVQRTDANTATTSPRVVDATKKSPNSQTKSSGSPIEAKKNSWASLTEYIILVFHQILRTPTPQMSRAVWLAVCREFERFLVRSLLAKCDSSPLSPRMPSPYMEDKAYRRLRRLSPVMREQLENWNELERATRHHPATTTAGVVTSVETTAVQFLYFFLRNLWLLSSKVAPEIAISRTVYLPGMPTAVLSSQPPVLMLPSSGTTPPPVANNKQVTTWYMVYTTSKDVIDALKSVRADREQLARAVDQVLINLDELSSPDLVSIPWGEKAIRFIHDAMAMCGFPEPTDCPDVLWYQLFREADPGGELVLHSNSAALQFVRIFLGRVLHLTSSWVKHLQNSTKPPPREHQSVDGGATVEAAEKSNQIVVLSEQPEEHAGNSGVAAGPPGSAMSTSGPYGSLSTPVEREAKEDRAVPEASNSLEFRVDVENEMEVTFGGTTSHQSCNPVIPPKIHVITEEERLQSEAARNINNHVVVRLQSEKTALEQKLDEMTAELARMKEQAAVESVKLQQRTLDVDREKTTEILALEQKLAAVDSERNEISEARAREQQAVEALQRKLVAEKEAAEKFMETERAQLLDKMHALEKERDSAEKVKKVCEARLQIAECQQRETERILKDQEEMFKKTVANMELEWQARVQAERNSVEQNLLNEVNAEKQALLESMENRQAELLAQERAEKDKEKEKTKMEQEALKQQYLEELKNLEAMYKEAMQEIESNYSGVTREKSGLEEDLAKQMQQRRDEAQQAEEKIHVLQEELQSAKSHVLETTSRLESQSKAHQEDVELIAQQRSKEAESEIAKVKKEKDQELELVRAKLEAEKQKLAKEMEAQREQEKQALLQEIERLRAEREQEAAQAAKNHATVADHGTEAAAQKKAESPPTNSEQQVTTDTPMFGDGTEVHSSQGDPQSSKMKLVPMSSPPVTTSKLRQGLSRSGGSSVSRVNSSEMITPPFLKSLDRQSIRSLFRELKAEDLDVLPSEIKDAIRGLDVEGQEETTPPSTSYVTKSGVIKFIPSSNGLQGQVDTCTAAVYPPADVGARNKVNNISKPSPVFTEGSPVEAKSLTAEFGLNQAGKIARRVFDTTEQEPEQQHSIASGTGTTGGVQNLPSFRITHASSALYQKTLAKQQKQEQPHGTNRRKGQRSRSASPEKHEFQKASLLEASRTLDKLRRQHNEKLRSRTNSAERRLNTTTRTLSSGTETSPSKLVTSNRKITARSIHGKIHRGGRGSTTSTRQEKRNFLFMNDDDENQDYPGQVDEDAEQEELEEVPMGIEDEQKDLSPSDRSSPAVKIKRDTSPAWAAEMRKRLAEAGIGSASEEEPFAVHLEPQAKGRSSTTIVIEDNEPSVLLLDENQDLKPKNRTAQTQQKKVLTGASVAAYPGANVLDSQDLSPIRPRYGVSLNEDATGAFILKSLQPTKSESLVMLNAGVGRSSTNEKALSLSELKQEFDRQQSEFQKQIDSLREESVEKISTLQSQKKIDENVFAETNQIAKEQKDIYKHDNTRLEKELVEMQNLLKEEQERRRLADLDLQRLLEASEREKDLHRTMMEAQEERVKKIEEDAIAERSRAEDSQTFDATPSAFAAAGHVIVSTDDGHQIDGPHQVQPIIFQDELQHATSSSAGASAAAHLYNQQQPHVALPQATSSFVPPSRVVSATASVVPPTQAGFSTTAAGAAGPQMASQEVVVFQDPNSGQWVQARVVPPPVTSSTPVLDPRVQMQQIQSRTYEDYLRALYNPGEQAAPQPSTSSRKSSAKASKKRTPRTAAASAANKSKRSVAAPTSARRNNSATRSSRATSTASRGGGLGSTSRSVSRTASSPLKRRPPPTQKVGSKVQTALHGAVAPEQLYTTLPHQHQQHPSIVYNAAGVPILQTPLDVARYNAALLASQPNPVVRTGSYQPSLVIQQSPAVGGVQQQAHASTTATQQQPVAQQRNLNLPFPHRADLLPHRGADATGSSAEGRFVSTPSSFAQDQVSSIPNPPTQQGNRLLYWKSPTDAGAAGAHQNEELHEHPRVRDEFGNAYVFEPPSRSMLESGASGLSLVSGGSSTSRGQIKKPSTSLKRRIAMLNSYNAVGSSSRQQSVSPARIIARRGSEESATLNNNYGNSNIYSRLHQSPSRSRSPTQKKKRGAVAFR